MAKRTSKSASKRKSGAKPPQASPFVEGIAAGGQVIYVSLDEIDLGDETFMFRANLRTVALQKSIADGGQQMPIVVRRKGSKGSDGAYQLISGFRRVHAIKALGWDKVAAIVREDLADDDEAAFRAAVLENTSRKSYSDIDRAIVIVRYEQEGHKSTDVSAMMGLSKQAKNRIKSLLTLPQVAQDAVDDPEHPFKTKHAVVLKALATHYPDLDFGRWVAAVRAEALSTSALRKRVNKAHGTEPDGSGFKSLFQEKGTDWARGEIRFAPVKVKLAQMTTDEKETLEEELQRLLTSLRSEPT